MEQDTFYLVSFYGIPHWEKGQQNKVCDRRYLFSSMDKASAFVSRLTNSPVWYASPSQGEGSIRNWVRRDRADGFSIRPIVVDEAAAE